MLCERSIDKRWLNSSIHISFKQDNDCKKTNTTTKQKIVLSKTICYKKKKKSASPKVAYQNYTHSDSSSCHSDLKDYKNLYCFYSVMKVFVVCPQIRNLFKLSSRQNICGTDFCNTVSKVQKLRQF